MKRQLRNLQTFMPWARPVKFGFYNLVTKNFGMKIDPDFYILKHLPHVRRVLDIGGNWGQSVFAIKYLRPEASIHTFEPNPVLANRLKKVFSGREDVTVHNVALSSEGGHVDLYIPVYRNFVYDGLASLDANEASCWLNPQTLANFDPAKLSLRSYNVPVARLDALGLDADFVKIDVQGHELQVLNGAAGILSSETVILLESASQEIIDFLSTFSLMPFAFKNGRLVRNLLTTVNTVFMSEKKRLAQACT